MAELVIGAFLSASFDLLLQKIASPYVEKLLFNGENESSVKERLFKLQSTFNTLAAVRFEVENKRIKNPAVEKWLDDLLDVVDDAEDFFSGIEYDAMKPNKADESKKEKRKAISKLLSCFSKPSTSTERVRNANMEEILKRLEYLANQIGNLNLEKNVVDVQPSGSSRVKTSLPDEPELYVSTSFFVKSKDRSGRSIFLMHDLLVDLAKIVSGKYSSLLEHNEDTVKFEKKTRHLGCLMEHSTNYKLENWKSLYEAIKPRNSCSTLTPLYHYPPLQSLRLTYCGSSFRSLHLDLFPNLKTLHIESSDYFEAISVSDGKSLEELTSLSIRNCGSFVSFPNDGLIAPKLSSLRIANCRKLKWLPEKMAILSALNELEIIDCPLLEPFPEDAHERSLPVTLSSLIASPYVEELFFKGKNESAVFERLFKLKSTFNTLAAVRFEVENKRIKNPAVEKWLDDLLDGVDDAEDYFGDIAYDAMKPGKADESKKAKRKTISKLLSRFSKSSNSTNRVRNANMEEILKRLEYLANQIGNLNLEKNNSESLYEAIKPRNHCSTLTPLYHYPPLQELHLESCGSSFRSLHLDLFPNLITLHIESSNYFEAISVSDEKSLEELTSLSIKDCGSFVSFPNVLIAPKLSEFIIRDCSKLKWLPEQMTSLSSLESLTISKCPLIGTLPEDGLPIASPYVKDFFFKRKNESSSVVSERLFKLKSTFNSLAAVRFEVENKRIKNPAAEKWLDNLLDAIDDAEDFFGDIEYNAMKPNKAYESRKARRKASKLFSCFSNPSDSTDRVRNANMEEILKRLEYLANQIGNLNLEKNVVEVKPSEGSRAKTSLPDEPEIYVYHYPPLQVLRLWNCGSSFRSLHMDIFPNLKTLRIQSSHYFEALSMSNVKSLEQLSSLFIEHCSSFVSFPNGGLLAPKLSEFIIRDCPKLKWLPEKMTSLSSLESLTIKDCPLIEPFPKGEGEGNLPISLYTLDISDTL
ncbi:hypothetical protein G4B88_008225 [Cannabis sativa]|uniref:Disease resistance N-terminal domain-containing protein n=1 Tax=Cannabis sativa TaxID=3483 RepID=A0A7J6FP11_CANSA|nr:hypothetical protein G4B88_008225 [Cannabis sativa]